MYTHLMNFSSFFIWYKLTFAVFLSVFVSVWKIWFILFLFLSDCCLLHHNRSLPAVGRFCHLDALSQLARLLHESRSSCSLLVQAAGTLAAVPCQASRTLLAPLLDHLHVRDGMHRQQLGIAQQQRQRLSLTFLDGVLVVRAPEDCEVLLLLQLLPGGRLIDWDEG